MPRPAEHLTTYESLSVAELVKALREERLRLPPYQRRGVWDKDKQKALMVSLHKEWPIGSLLFARLQDAPPDYYTLIDGQQRATAISRFFENPCAFLNPDDISEPVLLALRAYAREQLNSNVDEKVDNAIRQWLSSCTSMETEGGFGTAKLQEALEIATGLSGHSSLTSKCEAVVTDLKRRWNLKDRRVSLTLYGGPSADIPEIFDLINTSGESLDKFDIYAAQWYQAETTDTVINNDAITEHIVAGYEQQRADGMTFETPFETREPMLVEYLFGLGKLLTEKFPLFFGKLSRANKMDEVGFNIAATAHQLKITQHEMGQLNDRMLSRHRNAAGKIDPSRFEKALLEACKFTKDVLGSILQIRLNKTNNDDPPEILHNTSHIISMICRVLAGKYEFDFVTQRAGWRIEQPILKQTLRQYYLEDILTNKWKGAAAGTLWDRVWQQQETGALVPSSFYLDRRDRTHWARILDNYNADLKAALKTGGRYVVRHHKVFLKYAVHSSLLSSQQNVPFEIEHLFPVSRLQDLIRQNGDQETGWPIDHVANLAIFSRKLNREKSKKTLHEYLESVSEAERRRLRREGLNMLMCRVQDVAIGRPFRRRQYEAFLDKRFERMSEHVCRCLFGD
jgi:hypothetical protein